MRLGSGLGLEQCFERRSQDRTRVDGARVRVRVRVRAVDRGACAHRASIPACRASVAASCVGGLGLGLGVGLGLGETYFHKPTQSASRHNECSQLTPLVVRVTVILRLSLGGNHRIITAESHSCIRIGPLQHTVSLHRTTVSHSCTMVQSAVSLPHCQKSHIMLHRLV